MKLINEVCSLYLSRKLNELGAKQESLFYWDWHSDTCYDIKFMPYSCPGLERYSAFTAAELLEMLPNTIDTKNNEPFSFFRFNMTRSFVVENNKITPTFIINYHCDTYAYNEKMPFVPRILFRNIWDENLANALAKTLIFLLENGLWHLK